MKIKKISLPDNMRPETEQYVRYIVNRFDREKALDLLDTGALHRLATNYDQYLLAVDMLNGTSAENGEGYVFLSDRGNWSISPWLTAKKDAEANLNILMKDFGLTLSSRSKLKSGDQEEDEPLFLQVLKNGK